MIPELPQPKTAGEPVWIETIGGTHLAVWIRRNRNLVDVVRPVYFTIGSERTVAAVSVVEPGPMRDAVDAISLALFHSDPERFAFLPEAQLLERLRVGGGRR